MFFFLFLGNVVFILLPKERLVRLLSCVLALFETIVGTILKLASKQRNK